MLKFILGVLVGVYLASQFPTDTARSAKWVRAEAASLMDRGSAALRD